MTPLKFVIKNFTILRFIEKEFDFQVYNKIPLVFNNKITVPSYE